jgi:hypothetical protein
MTDPIQDLKKLGIRLEADKGKTIYHRRIVSMQPIPHTKSGNNCTLSCGHRVQTYGRIDPLQLYLCTECRDAAKTQ